MKSAIKIIKRDNQNRPEKRQSEIERAPEQTRDMTLIIERWVAEFKERKRRGGQLLSDLRALE